MATLRKRRWVLGLAATAVAAVVLLFPLPVREQDRKLALQRSMQSLLQQRRVLLDGTFVPFYDAERIASRNPQWHCFNDTDFDATFVESSGVQPINEAAVESLIGPDWYERNALFEFTYRDSFNETGEPLLRFNVYHGTLAAQGYQVHVYRCLLGVFVSYTCEWVS